MNMRRGEVWLIELGETRGHEQAGTRPVIVIGISNGLAQVVPLTSNIDRADFPHTVIIYPDGRNGLGRSSVALVFQLVSLDVDRFTQRLGDLSKYDSESIDYLLRDLLGFD
jgi:mRNA interferase MazF